MYNVTALLPMKGHSQRLPNKNISNFCGKPLYTWVLDSLLNSKYIGKIIIDTDSEKIKNCIFEIYNNNTKILVVDRPDILIGDYISITELIRYDMSFAETEDILQTHATNPLLKTETINTAIEKYFQNKGKYDSLLTAIRHQSRLYFNDGTPINHKTNVMKRSQDEKIVYEENSNIFLFSKKSLEENNGRVGSKPFFYEMNKLESTDINEVDDFLLAEMLYRMNECQ